MATSAFAVADVSSTLLGERAVVSIDRRTCAIRKSSTGSAALDRTFFKGEDAQIDFSSSRSFRLRKCVTSPLRSNPALLVKASAVAEESKTVSPATKKIRIGSRKSALAMWQSEWVQARLREAYPGAEVTIYAISTKGDKILDVPLAKIGDKGLFTKELEVELQEGNVDLVVHSLKDLQTNLPDDLELGAVSERHDPSDALVIRPDLKDKYKSIDDIPEGAIVGTSSLRRIAQLRNYRPDLNFKDVRGNVQTRLSKLDAGDYDAIVLATAGLERLGYGDRISQKLPSSVTLHAVGQGALGIEIRKGDEATQSLLKVLDHAATRAACLAERAFMRTLEGGCQVPIGVRTNIEGDVLTLMGVVLSLDGKRCIRMTHAGPLSDPDAVGNELAEQVKAAGGMDILSEIYRVIPYGSK
eukprot:CAMPEP_0184347616 /NCGR_PEP_ID=MMETSP1089-20130417/18838_1 /TAXON_ID=38269 ORGANISM="Gloeochaete wittrockiana, Strain SAG46.84" /NCGR_SAMPLE_ID=MMETSP1089 /ASSEMBLY_ACC=CAM_ASM_000445 /LENGTH=412 /DNA_ID=CAMNT_0026678777 /DNA_START=42 /DNA_END=1280 /DNA_ORIENTATION=-